VPSSEAGGEKNPIDKHHFVHTTYQISLSASSSLTFDCVIKICVRRLRNDIAIILKGNRHAPVLQPAVPDKGIFRQPEMPELF
jgi:hypothetical protein